MPLAFHHADPPFHWSRRMEADRDGNRAGTGGRPPGIRQGTSLSLVSGSSGGRLEHDRVEELLELQAIRLREAGRLARGEGVDLAADGDRVGALVGALHDP